MAEIIVKVDNTNFVQQIDTAYITITSPSGKSLQIMRTRITRFSREQLTLFWKFCGDPMVKRVDYEVKTTKLEMKELLYMSKV